MSSGGPQYPQYPGQEPGEQRPDPTPDPTPEPPPQMWPPVEQPWGAPTQGAVPPPPPVYGPPVTSNDKATWSLILGIVSMVCCPLLASLPAIILAVMAKKEIAASGGTQPGGGLATAGLVLGIISTVLSLLYIVFIVVLAAFGGFETA